MKHETDLNITFVQTMVREVEMYLRQSILRNKPKPYFTIP